MEYFEINTSSVSTKYSNQILRRLIGFSLKNHSDWNLCMWKIYGIDDQIFGTQNIHEDYGPKFSKSIDWQINPKQNPTHYKKMYPCKVRTNTYPKLFSVFHLKFSMLFFYWLKHSTGKTRCLLQIDQKKSCKETCVQCTRHLWKTFSVVWENLTYQPCPVLTKVIKTSQEGDITPANTTLIILIGTPDFTNYRRPWVQNLFSVSGFTPPIIFPACSLPPPVFTIPSHTHGKPTTIEPIIVKKKKSLFLFIWRLKRLNIFFLFFC